MPEIAAGQSLPVILQPSSEDQRSYLNPPIISQTPSEDQRSHLEKMMAELPFEVRAILEDEPSVCSSTSSSTTSTYSPHPSGELHSMRPENTGGQYWKACKVILLILLGIFLGLLIFMFVISTVIAFALPNSTWEGGLCPPDWIQHLDSCYRAGGGPPQDTYENAKLSCRALGGKIASSSKAIGFLTILDRLFYWSGSTSPQGLWWADDGGKCANVYFINSIHDDSTASLSTQKMSVALVENLQCSGTAGVICYMSPAISPALRYIKALRVALSFGVYEESK